MNAILNNPYRTLGLLIGTSAKEEHSKSKKLKMYIEADQDPPEEFSFPVLGILDRSLQSVEAAISQLNLNNDRAHASLFWFFNGNAITDEPAFDFLKEGNVDGAAGIWKKLVANGEVALKNFSAFQNLASLLICQACTALQLTQICLDKVVSIKLKFLESDFFPTLDLK